MRRLWLSISALALVYNSAARRSDDSPPPSPYNTSPVSLYDELDSGPGDDSFCADIPADFTLCADVGYRRMRLPNFLGHDTLNEVRQASSSWRPFLALGCHPNARLFLCSLVCPVCVDRPIFPCRSLCLDVRGGCETRMRAYGFPWPPALDCFRFPPDNDLCIAPPPSTEPSKSKDDCTVCNQLESYENILDHFCRADIAIKTKVRNTAHKRLVTKKAKLLKGMFPVKKDSPMLLHLPGDGCCHLTFSHQRYLIMGTSTDGILNPTLVMSWKMKTSKVFKRAVHMFNKFNCSDTTAIAKSLMGNGKKSKAIEHNVKKGRRKAVIKQVIEGNVS